MGNKASASRKAKQNGETVLAGETGPAGDVAKSNGVEHNAIENGHKGDGIEEPATADAKTGDKKAKRSKSFNLFKKTLSFKKSKAKQQTSPKGNGEAVKQEAAAASTEQPGEAGEVETEEKPATVHNEQTPEPAEAADKEESSSELHAPEGDNEQHVTQPVSESDHGEHQQTTESGPCPPIDE